MLPSIISLEQTAYIEKRLIGESGRLTSDILSVTNNLKIKSYLVTMDIEKAFESPDHSFLILVLKKFGFGENFIDWIKILLYKQESCVLNSGFTIKYFNLEKCARQGVPTSAYLFILALEIIFLIIKNDSSKKGTKVFDYVFLIRHMPMIQRFSSKLQLKNHLIYFLIIRNILVLSQAFLSMKLLKLGP